MRSTAVSTALLVALVSVGCDRGSANDAQLGAELERDLAAAAAATVELANGAQGYKPMRFVSEVEQIPTSKPAPRRPKQQVEKAVEEAPAEHHAPSPEPEPVAEPVVETTVAEPAPTPTTEETIAADAPRVPVVAPRPAPMPVDVPERGGSSGRARGVDEGPDWGTVIGVVIRGGRVGDRHCPPRTRGRNPFPYPNYEAAPPVLRPIVHP
ncbi:MAG TPA: hypothetical protein VF178_06045 [Gemmatimonadaceae bacterium]